MRHPDRVARIVGVDIGDTVSGEYRRSLPARAKAMIVGYQSVLAMAYWIPARVGDAVTRRMARWLRAPADPGCAVQGLRTGHWVMTAEPEAFNRIVEDWLDGRG